MTCYVDSPLLAMIAPDQKFLHSKFAQKMVGLQQVGTWSGEALILVFRGSGPPNPPPPQLNNISSEPSEVPTT